MRSPIEQREITHTIIGCAYKVYNRMKFGHAEKVYENCMMIELAKAGLKAEAQKGIKVFYEGQLVGEYVADILVEDEIIVELKSVTKLSKAHEVQLVNYLVSTGKPLGLLINFGESQVEVRRKVKDLSQVKTDGDHQDDIIPGPAPNPGDPVDPV